MASLEDILNWVQPAAAHAEIIPQSQGAANIFTTARAQPGQAGEAVRQLHEQPEKVYLYDEASWPMKLMNALSPSSTLGTFNPRFLKSGYNINLNPALIKDYARMSGERPEKAMTEALGHEAGHGLAQVARIGGIPEPTGVPFLNFLNFMAHLPFSGGFRVKRGLNEQLADALAGTNYYGTPSTEAQSLAERTRNIIENRRK